MAEAIIKDFNDAHRMGISAKELADRAWSKPITTLVISAKDFVANFSPPDYLIDGVVQRRFIYSMTAPTGAGKTAIALLLSVLVAKGDPLGEHEIGKGRVLYLAGENPEDIRMRLMAMSDQLKFDIETLELSFIEGTFSIPNFFERIKSEITTQGEVSLVVVDTSAAYFTGDEENNKWANMRGRCGD